MIDTSRPAHGGFLAVTANRAIPAAHSQDDHQQAMASLSAMRKSLRINE